MEHGNVKQFLEQAPRSDCVTLVSKIVKALHLTRSNHIHMYVIQSLDIAQGLEYLHNENIIHGDLKAVGLLPSMLANGLTITSLAQYIDLEVEKSLPCRLWSCNCVSF